MRADTVREGCFLSIAFYPCDDIAMVGSAAFGSGADLRAGLPRRKSKQPDKQPANLANIVIFPH